MSFFVFRMADYDMSDVSISDASWADAQADTPTMGEGHSGSEVRQTNTIIYAIPYTYDIQEQLPVLLIFTHAHVCV